MLRPNCKSLFAPAALFALSFGLVAGAIYAPLPAFATRTPMRRVVLRVCKAEAARSKPALCSSSLLIIPVRQ